MGIAETTAADLKLNVRGNPHALGDVVPRGLPGILGGTKITNGSGRLDLAEAIVRHPLAARVIANRIWMHHFGRGIVATPSNFGAGGERPTHPELLDYLASRLVEGGWSLKSLHREIMLSAAYQLSANAPGRRGSRKPVVCARERAAAGCGIAARLAALRGRRAGRDRRGTARRAEQPGKSAADDLCPHSALGVRVQLRNGRARPHAPAVRFSRSDDERDHRTNTNVPLQGLFFLNSELGDAGSGVAARVSARAIRRHGPDRERV